MKLVWRPLAEVDRDRIFEFIAEDNPLAALELDDEFDQVAERLLENPALYRRGRVAGTREAVVRPNYVMVYRVTDEEVEILNILHARQQWPSAE